MPDLGQLAGLTVLEVDVFMAPFATMQLADSAARYTHRAELLATVEAATARFDAAALVAALESEGVPCAPINDYGQVFTDDQLTSRGFLWDAPHPELGPVRQLGSPMRLSSGPPRHGAAGPPLGADTRAVLGELGYSGAEIDALVESGAAA
jgi:formyl-CoA transferase